MNERTKNVLERMRQNTQAVVDAAFEEIAMEQTTQPRTCQTESYQIIVFPKQIPMNPDISRHPKRHRKFQVEMLT